MLRTTLSRTLWSCYDALSKLVLGNLFWFLLTAPWWGALYLFSRRATFPLSVAVATCGVPIALLNPGSAGLACMAQRLAQTGETDLRTFWSGVRAQVFRSILLMSFGVLITMTFGAGVVFYLRGSVQLLGGAGNLGAAVVTGAVGIVLAAMTCYWMPVSVGVSGKSPRIWFVFRRAGALASSNAGYTGAILLLTIIAAGFWIATVIGVLAVGMSFITVFHAEARCTLREREEVVWELHRQGASPSRHTIKQGLNERWAHEDRRAVRELARAGRA